MAPLSEDVFFSTAVELNQRLVRRDFTAVELARAFGERLEKLGPRYNALALSLREQALRQAHDVDRELKRGRTRGPLQGVPYGVKDLLAVAGRPTTWGAPPYAGQVFSEDAAVVRRLGKQGAVLVGKLAMVSLAGGGGYRYAAASLQGAGLNPWDRTRWAGGSSSGSAAAVAAGLAPYALGSETNGSIVTPAAYCGVTGLRPTYGLVSRRGAMPLAWTMDKIGPLAHTAEDCGHVLAAIAGGDGDDPGSAGRPFHFAPQFARAIRDLRIGIAPADIEVHAAAPMRAVLREAVEQFRQMGATIVELELPDFPYSAVASMIIGAEGAASFAGLIRSAAIETLPDRRQVEGLKAGLRITAADYLQAMRARRLIQQAMGALMAKADVLLAPARYTVATKVDEALDGGRAAGTGIAPRGFRMLTTAGNLAGLPALVLPCGFAEGLPVGIGLTGRAFSENTLLKLGMEYQRLTKYHRRKPAV
ncbi:MAG TPA: amidase [Paludibaculum sp.]|jgi:aspartyl-tRNA(Asn)/glutamyl-tRNA(Gln) amidotransferase subunit A